MMMIDTGLDATAAAEIEGVAAPDRNAALDAVFEEFRLALQHAQKVGSINAMRAAVAAYDRFAAAIGATS